MKQEMPENIYAESVDKMHWFETVEDAEGCGCGGLIVRYVRADKYETAIKSLQNILQDTDETYANNMAFSTLKELGHIKND